jgi:hypothetical protein
MSRRVRISLALLLMLFQASCFEAAPADTGQSRQNFPASLAPPPTLTPLSPSTESPNLDSPNSISSLSNATQSNASAPRPSYVLDATLDYAAHTLSGDETITYLNSTGQSLANVVMAVEPSLWKNCFSLTGLSIQGKSLTDYDLTSGRLEVPLPALLQPGDPISLSLHFDLTLPPADSYHLFGYNSMQANLVDWYPFIVPYSDDWLLHPPSNVGEHLLYDSADFDVTLHVLNGSGAIIAGPGLVETVDGGWRYRLNHARTFAFSASPFYKMLVGAAGNIPIAEYYFEPEKQPAQAVLSEVNKAVETYSDLFGPYPQSSLTMVESPFFDGMEYDGLFFLSRDYYISSDGTVLNNLIDIAVHETAHQWWFGSVGNDQALEPWLDEALATYSERLFYEKNYPQVNAWQAFRIDAFEPVGWVNTDIYHGGHFRSYANAVYLRGGLFLQALRERVGDEAFFAFLKDYALQMAGKRATAQDFFRILSLHSGASVADIVSSYFR